jgi:4-amino-4-deoxy-L-arabinose transferase-like glycosyltransferase
VNFFLGYVFLLLILFVILLKFKKYPQVKKLLLVAFMLRAIMVIIDQSDLITLPDGEGDTLLFTLKAIEFSRTEGVLVVKNFLNHDSLLISRIISIFYTVFGESTMMAQNISVGLGTASVYLVYQLCLLLWDHRSATKAAWVMAFFPSLILYSSLALREVYIVFFLLLGLISILKFVRKKTITLFFKIMTYFFILMLFHGPMVLGGFVFLFYLLLSLVKKQLIKANSLKINISYFFYIIISTISLILFLTNQFSIPYVGGFHALLNLDLLISKVNDYVIGAASYPSWLVVNNNLEFFPKSIIKIFYFLYSPFIWDIKSIYQMLGLIDGVTYFILTLYVVRNWHIIWENPITRIFIFILIAYLIIYGISIGNFGTGIRHRSKLVVILIVLAAPKIHKLIFSFKKKLYKK